ncbi:glycosyltransferase [Tepidiforma bonchosmolovskayae]|uniref:Glycosyltransferase family 4 protein n=1 Tax=Tepidiforma bonchosmolovskayae TaxID=2601677 RepID=A0ABX6C0S1_9CHLR|nr:glycosyltransferase [Tepidiforma bonchosmolovskayae]QFG02885.1 glycosyltransferase family 4 protein [Tepidiforma bonchosmolovskayae]
MGPRILILARGYLGSHMSAPGIRATAQARVLAEHVPGARVTLAGPNEDYEQPADGAYRVTRWSARNLLQLTAAHDVVISSMLPPHIAIFYPWKRYVVDLFSQYAMEWMEVGMQHYEGRHRDAWAERTRAVLGMQLTLADFILTCNERQRDSYIGMMTSLGLISPRVYEADPTLRRYIDSAPHGIRPEPPIPGERVLRGVRPGFGEHDRIILWNGGIIQWYDPATLIEALRLLNRDDVKLLFLGASYPGIRELGKGVRFQDAKAIAARNGQLNRTIFFEEGWVSHEEAKQYVLEADISVCTYFDNMETRYSHRTRFVDLIWGELPFICTHGDVLAEEVAQEGWGLVVPEGDAPALAQAIAKLLDDREFYTRCRANLAAARPRLQWSATMKPLIRFCMETGEPVSPKWERLPGLAQRLTAYTARRAVFNFFDRKLKQRSERLEAAEKKERLRQERLARFAGGGSVK